MNTQGMRLLQVERYALPSPLMSIAESSSRKALEKRQNAQENLQRRSSARHSPFPIFGSSASSVS